MIIKGFAFILHDSPIARYYDIRVSRPFLFLLSSSFMVAAIARVAGLLRFGVSPVYIWEIVIDE